MPIPYNISQSPVPVSISGTPTGATQRQAYSWSPTVTGGFGVRTFTMTGNLPERMTFNPFTGTIAGIPRHVISVSGLSITVTDASGSATLSNLTIPVASAISNLMITGTPDAATVGSAYTFTPTVTGGSGPRTYSFSGRLEDGLYFNPAAGAISGTPTEDGGSFFIITVQDSVDTATLSGTVVASYPGGGVVPAPAGYVLSYADDFSGPLDIITPAKPAGRYSTTRAYMLNTANNGPRGATGGLPLKIYDIDTFHTGHNDANRGAAMPSWSDAMVQSGGKLTLKARRASSGEQALFNPSIGATEIGAMICSPQAIVAMLPCVFEATFALTKAQASMLGWHPSFWTMQMGPPASINSLEMDWEGNSDVVRANTFEWNAGVSTQFIQTSGLTSVFDGVLRTYRLEITATSRRWLYKNPGDTDFTAFRTLTRAHPYPDKPHYFLLTNHIANFSDDLYSSADWAAAGAAGATQTFDNVRVFRSESGAHYAPSTVSVTYATPFNTAFSFVLPTATSVWGSNVSEVVEAYMVESSEPSGGYNGSYSGFPAGVAYDPATRTLSGTVSDKAGTIHIVRYATAAGSSCEPQRIALNVGPRLTQTSLTMTTSGTLDLYPLCDCGQMTSDANGNRAKTISVAIPGASGFTFANDILTAPAGATSATIPVTITNNAGQSVTTNLAVTVQAAAGALVAPVTSGLLVDIDPGETAKVTSNNGLISAIGPANGTSYGATSSGALRPTPASISGKRSVARFDGAREMSIDPAALAALNAAGAYTMAVICTTTTAGSAASQTMLDIAKASADSTHSRLSLLFVAGSPGLPRHRVSSATANQDATALAPYALDVPHLIVGSMDTGSIAPFIRLDSAAGRGATVTTASYDYDSITIGNRKSSSGASLMNGDIHRVLIWTRNLTGTEKDALAAWAVTNYGTL